jgi:hypothetical protein
VASRIPSDFRAFLQNRLAEHEKNSLRLLMEWTINSDRLTCIFLEVAINASTANPHESAEDAALRTQLAAQCAAMTASGAINIPSDKL